MKWKTKSLIFRVLDIVPFSNSIHDFIKRRVTKTIPRSERDSKNMLIAANKILDFYNKESTNKHIQTRFLEIGAGTDLVMAICLRALGVKEVVTTDVNFLAKLAYVNSSASIVAKELGVDMPFFRSFKELEDYGVFYHPNTRIQELSGDGDNGKYECIYSSDTLEHIGFNELSSIHKHVHRLLTDTGIIIHLIDVSDHYARADSSITRFNFLSYSDIKWKQYNHRSHYVNRLRPFQYKNLFEEQGFTVLVNEKDIEEDEVLSIELIDNKFRNMKRDEIFALRARFVLRP